MGTLGHALGYKNSRLQKFIIPATFDIYVKDAVLWHSEIWETTETNGIIKLGYSDQSFEFKFV